MKHEGHPSYVSWRDMRHRCRSKWHKSYPYYGGRGIKVCERWMKFENFVADMGVKAPGMTLERNDNDGDYEPKNCRWATRAEQNRNNRKTRLLTFKGKMMCIVDWAKETGINPHTLGDRVRNGWSVKRALTEKTREL